MVLDLYDQSYLQVFQEIFLGNTQYIDVLKIQKYSECFEDFQKSTIS